MGKSTYQKQPYLGLSAGTLVRREQQDLYWRRQFLSAALKAVPRIEKGGGGRTLAVLLLEEAHPLLHSPVQRTRLLQECNLDGYLTETGERAVVPWVSQVLFSKRLWLGKNREDFAGIQQNATHEVTLPVTVLAFSPLAMTEAQWRRASLEVFEKAMKDYLQSVSIIWEAIKAAGEYTKVKRKRETEHLEWLARYQVEGKSYHAIREESGKADLRTVQEAIMRTAELIGLPLRAPTRGGRPRKMTGHNS